MTSRVLRPQGRCWLPHCVEGRPDQPDHGVRYFKGSATDGYLHRTAPTPSDSVVIFRERHVADLHSTSNGELARFWSEVATMSRAIEAVFAPVHLNACGDVEPSADVARDSAVSTAVAAGAIVGAGVFGEALVGEAAVVVASGGAVVVSRAVVAGDAVGGLDGVAVLSGAIPVIAVGLG
jgi:hypothetical protein